MDSRIISPAREEWDRLPTPLTSGERLVAEFFDSHLPEGWEIYLQPRINGLQPDFLLLHPEFGVGVFEVKDWDPERVVCSVKRGGEVSLVYSPKQGRSFEVSAGDNPFRKVHQYKRHVHDLCTGFMGNSGFGRITAGVIFTCGTSQEWSALGRPYYSESDLKNAVLWPVSGRDALESGRLHQVFPYGGRAKPAWPEAVLGFLRSWLREPDFVRQQREPLPVPAVLQRRLIDRGPGKTGFRKIRGPAGSGKSFVLAARAARVALDLVRAGESPEVLVMCFNITLRNYLHDLAYRYLRSIVSGASSREQARLAFRCLTFQHFHGWSDAELCPEEFVGHYDAVVVDELQDFSLAWWQELRKSVKPGGEMMGALDETQSLYSHGHKSWTEGSMRAAGFWGGWNNFSVGYRVHQHLLPALRDFAAFFMPEVEVNLPEPAQGVIAPLRLRWVQIDNSDAWISVCFDELKFLADSLPADSGWSDIVCLLPEHKYGLSFVESVERGLGFKVTHVFTENDDSSRRTLKLNFWGGSGLLKASTVHSYKGWESRHMLIYVDDVDNAALFYVALTRLVQHIGGSSLTVVSECPELRDFGRKFFADFVELGSDGSVGS